MPRLLLSKYPNRQQTTDHDQCVAIHSKRSRNGVNILRKPFLFKHLPPHKLESGTKIPLTVEAFRLIEAGKFSLEDKITLQESGKPAT
jgi:hypothetical protein